LRWSVPLAQATAAGNRDAAGDRLLKVPFERGRVDHVVPVLVQAAQQGGVSGGVEG
jgi:hypothetical protein